MFRDFANTVNQNVRVDSACENLLDLRLGITITGEKIRYGFPGDILQAYVKLSQFIKA